MGTRRQIQPARNVDEAARPPKSIGELVFDLAIHTTRMAMLARQYWRRHRSHRSIVSS